MPSQFLAISRAPWFQRLWGKNPDLMPGVGAAWSNGFTQRIAKAMVGNVAQGDIDGIGSDTNNNLMFGGAAYRPQRQQMNFDVQPNSLQASQAFWVSDGYYYITATALKFHVAATTAGPVTGQIFIDRGTSAVGAGTNGGASLMSNTFDMKGTIDVNQNATLAANYGRSTVANAKLSPLSAPLSAIVVRPGDRLSLVTSTQTLTSLAGVAISVTVAPGSISQTFTYYKNSATLMVTSPFAPTTRPGFVVSGITIYATAPSSGACTLNVTYDADGTAAGGGVALLASTVNMATFVAGATITPALTATVANLTLGSGRLSVLFTGTTTGITGLVVSVSCTPSGYQEIAFSQASNTNIGTNQTIAGPFDRDYMLSGAYASIETAAGGTYTVALTADAPGVAPGAGSIMQTDNANAGFSLNGTPATLVAATLADRRLRYLPAGYTIGTKFAGTKGATAGLVIGAALALV